MSSISKISLNNTEYSLEDTSARNDLVNIASIIPIVDQVYNGSSTNAQSGTAVAGLIANYMTASDVINVINTAVSSVYRYKGSVANYSSLPASGQAVGDVYNVEDTGDNYAWDGTAWDKLAGTVDLSNYVTLNTAQTVTNKTINLADNTVIGLATVATSGEWNNIVNKPSFATVATTGEYSDLLNKPSIPDAQVQSDWNAVSGMGVILNKPTLATVATNGSYNDLLNKPTLSTVAGTGEYSDLLNKPTIVTPVQSDWAQTNSLSLNYIVNKPTLASIATSGDYNDLTNKPSIPAAQVQSDWNATSGMGVILNKPTIPTVDQTYNALSTNAQSGMAVSNAIATKQDNLVSGTNIKTINGNSLLGSGNIDIETSSTPNVDGETISYNSNEALQTIAVKNKRDGSTLPIWQGTQTQWNRGVLTTWYYWQTGIAAGWEVGGNLPVSSRWQFLCYGNGRYVAQTQAYSYSAYSTDGGETWTSGGTLPSGGGKIAFGNNCFVSIAGGSGKTAYSTDGGETWTQGGNLPFSGDARNPLAFGNNRFVAVNFFGSDTAYSTDGGETWTSGGTLPFSGIVSDIAYGNDVFIVVSNTNTGAYSTDGGETWTQFQLSESITGCSIAFGNERFVICGKYGNNLKVYFSNDNGVTWIKSNTDLSGFTTDSTNVQFGNNIFLTTNYYTASNYNISAYSADGGETWTFTSLPSSKSWSCLAFGNDKFVTIGYDTTDSAIFSVDYKKCYTLEENPTTITTVYSAPEVISGYTISSVTSGAITLSDNNTYYYNPSGNAYTYQSVGTVHPDWLCFINGVGVKIGNTTIASI